MNTRVKKTLHTTLLVSLAVLAIAAALAFVVLVVGHFTPAAGDAHIRWGSHSTTLSEVFSGNWVDFFLTWAVVTLAMLIAIAAVVFAIIVTFCALAFTAGALALSAAFVGLPFILIAVVIWWVTRRNKPTSVPQRLTPQS